MRLPAARFVAVLCLVAAPFVSGCSSGGEGGGTRQKTVNVTGVVTYRGNPVEGATVTFSPGTASDAKSAFGVTDAQGKYSLGTYVSNDGAVPGKYFVTVTKVMSSTRAPDPIDEKDYVPVEDLPQQKAPPQPNMIPPKYAAPTSSGLNAEVKSEGSQTFDFELKD